MQGFVFCRCWSSESLSEACQRSPLQLRPQHLQYLPIRPQREWRVWRAAGAVGAQIGEQRERQRKPAEAKAPVCPESPARQALALARAAPSRCGQRLRLGPLKTASTEVGLRRLPSVRALQVVTAAPSVAVAFRQLSSGHLIPQPGMA